MKYDFLDRAGFSLLLVAVMTYGVGCHAVPEPEDADGQDIAMLEMPEARPHVTHVTIRNGAGEVVAESDVEREAGLNLPLDTDKLDGTLHVATDWSNGKTYDQVLKHDEDNNFDIRYNGHHGRFSIDRRPNTAADATASEAGESASTTFAAPAPGVEDQLARYAWSGWTLDTWGGYASADVPQVNFGTLRDGPDDIALVESDDKLEGYRLGLNLSYALPRTASETLPRDLLGLYNRHSLYFAGSYGEMEDENRFMEPYGSGRGVAFTYFDESPSGATGVDFGDTGASGRISTDLRSYEIELGTRCDRPLTERIDLGLTGGLHFMANEYEHAGRISSAFYDDSFMELDEEIEEYYLGLKLGGLLSYRISNAWSLYGGGDVGAYYRNADLDVMQSFNVPVNPNPADRQFSISQSDGDDGFALGLGGKVGLRYDLAPFSLDFFSRINWLSDVAEAKHPTSPQDPQPYLDSSEQVGWTVGLSAGYQF